MDISMKSFFHSVGQIALGGIIVAAISYFFLYPREEKLSLVVQENAIEISTASSLQLISKLMSDSDETNDIEKLKAKWNFYGGLLIQTYEIKNEGSKIYDVVGLDTTGFKWVAIQQGGKSDVYEGNAEIKFKMVPNEIVKVTGLSDGQLGFLMGTAIISVNGSAMPIVNLRVETDDPFYFINDFVMNYPFLVFMLSMGGILLYGLLGVVPILAWYYNNDIAWRAKITSDKDFAGEIVALEHIELKMPERAAKIKALADSVRAKNGMQPINTN